MKTLAQLKAELRKTQQAQAECLNDYNIVKAYRRYEYQHLVRKARKLKEKIDERG